MYTQTLGAPKSLVPQRFAGPADPVAASGPLWDGRIRLPGSMASGTDSCRSPCPPGWAAGSWSTARETRWMGELSGRGRST